MLLAAPDPSDPAAQRPRPAPTRSTSLGVYFAELRRLPPVSADEERTLVQAMAAGAQAAARLAAGPPAADRAALAARVAQGAAARDRLVEAHLRLVVALACRARGGPVSLVDLIQEGNLGLVEAAGSFDPGRGARFATYATWRIRQALSRARAAAATAFHVPAGARTRAGALAATAAALAEHHRREPTTAELAVAGGITEAAVEALRRVRAPLASLDAPTADGHRLGDRLADDAASPAEPVDAAAQRAAVAAALARLHPREQAVLRQRFGLDGGPARPVAAVAAALGLSATGVRQIEERALRRIRSSPTAGLLAGAG